MDGTIASWMTPRPIHVQASVPLGVVARMMLRHGIRHVLVVDEQGRGMQAIFWDFDQDGDDDLYVANDYGAEEVLLNQEGKRFGIEVLDVRIGRTELPEQISRNVYDRMITERQREANKLRAEGEEIAARIRAEADRQRTVIVAEAERESAITRGQGDAEKERILRDAYQSDAEFFAFYRSMEAYRKALADGNTSLVLSPDSEFFKYFEGSGLSAPN